MGDGARGRERERAPEDLYAILGVARDASKAVLKNAYRRLAIQLHPDKTKDDQAAQERFKKVNEAYRTLLDEQKRAAYDRAGHAGLDEEANKEKREKLKAGFLAWAKQYFDEKSSKGLYKTLKRLLEEFGDYDHFIANDLLTAEGMIERIPEGERKAYMDKREEIISRVLAERQARGSGARAGAGAGAGAGARGGAGAGDPGRGGDTGERERARREYEAKKKKFDEAFDGWMDDARDGSLFKDALHLLRQGQSFEDVTRTAGRDFGGVFDASGLPVSDRPGYLKRMRETLQRAKDAYEASRAGAGAGGGNRRDAGNQEQEHRERQRETFRIKMDGLFNERAFGGFYAEALSFLNRGYSLEDVQRFAEIRFINELRGYEAYVTEQDKKLYRARIKAALQSAKDAYEASRAGAGASARGDNRGDSGNREQERERKRREFRSRADQLIAGMAEYVKTNLVLGHTLESIKAVSLEVLDKMRKEYPDLSEAEAQTYRARLQKSIDDAAAAFEKSKPKDRAKRSV